MAKDSISDAFRPDSKPSFDPRLLADDFFRQCLTAAASNKELVTQFDRLTGHNLSRSGKPIELMVDDASGRTEAALRDFVAFVRDCIYTRLQEYKIPDPHKWEFVPTDHPFLTPWKCKKCGATCITNDGTGDVPKSKDPCLNPHAWVRDNSEDHPHLESWKCRKCGLHVSTHKSHPESASEPTTTESCQG